MPSDFTSMNVLGCASKINEPVSCALRRPLDGQAHELQVDLNMAFVYQALGTLGGRRTGGETRRQQLSLRVKATLWREESFPLDL